MKRLYMNICILFLSLSIFAQNSEYFYYYKGKKQYLELRRDYVFIQTTEKNILLNPKLLRSKDLVKFKEYNTSILLRGNKKMYWAEIELNQDETEDYNEQIAQLKSNKSIEVVSPYFKTKNNDKIGLSNFFYVKLRELRDTTLLRTFSDKHRTVVVKQDEFMPLWFLLSCTKATSKNALEMANMYYESGLYQYAEPDLVVETMYACTNDQFFPNQWGMRNTGQYGGTAGIDIRACDAWGLSTGRNVTVAIIDQGVELNHPDLQANIHPLSYDTENETSPSIIRGDHGIACAGIVGAVRSNNIGIAGVAPDCRLMSISSNVFVNLTTSMRLGRGINWAVTNGADIISNSWFNIQSTILDDAITNALTNGRNGLGCIVVFATGNDNSSIRYPANSNPNILTVGAISPCGQRKSPSSCDGENWGSNYGSQLDVIAPGVLIPTTDRQGNLGYNPNLPIHTGNGGNKITSDYNNRDYTVWFNGTSAATPHVAGVAALMLSVRPDLTGQQVRNVIEQTAQKVGGYSYANTPGRPNGTWHQEMGYGLVDAHAAVYAVAPHISGPSAICNQATYTIENLPAGATVQWSASNSSMTLQSGQGTATAVFRQTGFANGEIRAAVRFNGTVIANLTQPVTICQPSLSGPSTVCNQATYTVENLPAEATVQWSADPSTAVTLDASGNSVVLGRNTFSQQDVRLFAATYINGVSLTSLSKDIHLTGNENVPRVTLDPPSMTCIPSGNTRIFTAIESNNGQSFCYNPDIREIEWAVFDYSTIPPVMVQNYTTSNCNNLINESLSLYIHSHYQPYVLEFVCRAKNICGVWGEWGPGCSYMIRDNCGNPYNAFNACFDPSYTTLTVHLTDDLLIWEEAARQARLFKKRADLGDFRFPWSDSGKSGVAEVELWSATAMIRRIKTDQRCCRFPVSGLPRGMYFIRVTKDGKTHTEKLLKN